MFHIFVRSSLMKAMVPRGVKKEIKNIKTDNSDKKTGMELLAKQLKADYLVIKIIGIPLCLLDAFFCLFLSCISIMVEVLIIELLS